jgi:Yip1 domain
MTEELVVPAPEGPQLTEIQRVVDVFAAPSKTFIDIRRKATFWGPLVLVIVVSILFGFAIQQKVGWVHVFENNMRQNPAKLEKIEASPTADSIKAVSAKITAGVTYGYVVVLLIINAIFALLIWATVNFGFGGTSKYGQVYAVSFYANVVMNIKFLLAVIALFAGLTPDSFLISNPVGTNVGYYLSDAPMWLASLCTHIDIFEIWSLVLMILGVSIVAKVSRGKAAAVVIGWWLVLVLAGVAGAAAQS